MDWEGTEGVGYFSSSLVSGVGGDAANECEVKFTQGCLQEERTRVVCKLVPGFIVSSYPF